MSRSPQAISSAAVRRHLEAAGPTVAQVLAAVTTEGAPPVGIQPLVDHVEQTKRWALESGSRHAAWLLYMAARSCLAQIPEYAKDTEWVGGQVESEDLFVVEYRSLRTRLRALGRELPSWVSLGPAVPALELTGECTRLGRAIRPDWNWLGVQEGTVLLLQGRPAEAGGLFLGLTERGADEQLRCTSLRNALSCFLRTDTIADHSAEVEELAELAPGDRMVHVFAMSLAAARADRRAFEAALERAAEASGEPGHKYWMRVVEWNLGSWSAGTDQDSVSLLNRLSRELA